ncbi:MAG: RluA family pseudouridine synthase [Christensenellales bacterium]|jgi:23S rRNA pseudouridine955/2504/2580 synthase
MQQFYTVPQALDGQRADKAAQRLAGVSYAVIQKALRHRDVRLNDKPVKGDARVRAGDRLRLYLPQPKVEILYQDEQIVLVHKMAGVSVLPGEGHPGEDTLTARLIAMGDWQGAPPEPVHRLDHYTGGIVCFARTESARELLRQALAQNTIGRFYEAVCLGAPPEGLHEAYLRKDAAAARVTVLPHPAPGALTIRTRVALLRRGEGLSRVALQLYTGRTHQARAHLAYLGAPVLGDDKYGSRQANRAWRVSHQLLWHVRMTFDALPEPLAYLNGRSFSAPPVGLELKNRPLPV